MVQKKKEERVTQDTVGRPVKKTSAVLSETKGKHPSTVRKIGVSVLFILTIGLWVGIFYLIYDYYKAHQTEEVRGGRIVAEVGKDKIYLSDVQKMAEAIPQLSELPFTMIYPQLLDNLINTKVMVGGALKMGLDKDPKIQMALKMAREQILSQAYLARELEASITPDKLRALYDQQIKNYQPEEQIKARHILVKTQKEAKDIIIQLNAGADFAMLAEKKSLDAGENGGELGYFTKNMMIPEFGDAVFALKKGQLSHPIKTPFGWHVVLVEDKKLTEAPAFEEVQEQLQQAFMEQNAALVLKEARQAADVTVFVPTLQSEKSVVSVPVLPTADDALENPESSGEGSATASPAETQEAQAPAEAGTASAETGTAPAETAEGKAETK